MHAILNIVGEKAIKKIDRKGLLAVVKVIQDMFEGDINDPEAVSNRRSADI